MIPVEVNFATQMSKLSNIFKMIRCLSNAFASSNLLTLERERVFQQFVNAVAQALNQNSLVVEKISKRMKFLSIMLLGIVSATFC